MVNKRDACAMSKPMPLSLMRNTASLPTASPLMRICAGSVPAVNFKALVTRLTHSMRISASSPSTAGSASTTTRAARGCSTCISSMSLRTMA